MVNETLQDMRVKAFSLSSGLTFLNLTLVTYFINILLSRHTTVPSYWTNREQETFYSIKQPRESNVNIGSLGRSKLKTTNY